MRRRRRLTRCADVFGGVVTLARGASACAATVAGRESRDYEFPAASGRERSDARGDEGGCQPPTRLCQP